MNEILKTAIAQFIGRICARWPQNPRYLTDAGKPVPSVLVLKNPSRQVAQQIMDRGFANFRSFVILPSSMRPRWLLPLDNRHRLSEGFHIYSPYTPMARMLKRLVIIIIKAGWNGWGCNRVAVASKGQLPLEDLVCEVTGEREVTFAMSLGSGGKFQKLTVQVMRPNGKILGYIKLPLTRAATERLRHEAAILERLWCFTALRPYIPKVLSANEWADEFILFQSPGPPSPGPAEFCGLHESFLHALWNAYKVLKPGRAVVEEVAARWQEAAPLLGAELQALGRRALERAHSELDAVPIPCGIMHGDFAPWNTRVRDGHLFLFDWESTAWGAPILWDIFHFRVQVSTLLNKKGGWDSLPGENPSHQASFLLYLLRSVAQCFEEMGNCHPGIQFRKRILRRELA